MIKDITGSAIIQKFSKRYDVHEARSHYNITHQKFNQEVPDVRSHSFGFEIQQNVHAPVCVSVSGTQLHQQVQAQQDR